MDRRGNCSVCGYRFRLRKDGTVQTHHLYGGHDRNPDPCPGSGRPAKWAEHNRQAMERAQAGRS